MNSLRNNLLVIMTVFALVSCEKADFTESALILDTGLVAADGCGWMVELEDGELVHPTNGLPDAFQQDSLEVLIDYDHVSGQFTCGLAPQSYNQITITSVAEKQ